MISQEEIPHPKVLSWYQPKLELTTRQSAYIELLESSFMMRTPEGRTTTYIMTEYQKEFHSASINVLGKDAKDILFLKARGISFSFSSLIELIMTAMMYDGQTIPIIAHREKNAFKLIEVAKWLIDNCKIKEIKDDAEFKSGSIRFKSTGSVIEAFPSSSAADSVRSIRLIRYLVDEFAFQQHDEQLYTAINDCIQGDFGQGIYGSTPCGRSNMFFRLVDRVKRGELISKYKLFNLPVFDPTKFNPKMNIAIQQLIPIAPWISLKKLEEKREVDWRIFLQENMCDFLDDGLSLISFTTVMQRVNEELINYKTKLYTDFTYQTENKIIIGVDFSEYVDLFAITAFEEIETEKNMIYIQRYLDYFNGIETPELFKYMQQVFRLFPTFTLCRIDSTGSGSGLSNLLKREQQHRIMKVNFATSITVVGEKNKENIRKHMINNIKLMLEDKNNIVQLLNDTMQISHLTALNYRFEVERDKETGHGDIFFADALALLPLQQSINPMISNFKHKESHEEKTENDDRIIPQETWDQKLKRLKKGNSFGF